MEIVKLVDFVKNWEIFEKIEGRFDQIVSDFDFWDTEGFVKINNILDFKKINKNKSTLFILDKLLVKNIEEFLEMKNVVILDLNFGINSFGNKISVCNFDIVELFDKNISVYEPVDLLSLIQYLDEDSNKYIRINDLDSPGDFLWWELLDIIPMDKKGISGSNFTIVTTGSMLSELVRTINIMNEHWLYVELFILNRLNFDLDNEMMEDVCRNQNIMFVLDLLNKDSYEKWIRNKFKWVSVKFLYPLYNNISTVLDEYKSEEAKFDAMWLVERLQ